MKTRFATADIETDPFKWKRTVKPFMAGFFDGDDYFAFYGHDFIDKFVNKMLGFKGIIYFHNFGKFDFWFIHENLIKRGIITNVLEIGGRIVEIKTKDGTTFRDSLSLLLVALKKLGGKKDIDIDKLEEKNRQKHWQEIRDYLETDCRSLYDALENFSKNYPLTVTAASCAFKMFQTKFGHEMERTDHRFDSTFRPFYYGGRVSVFNYGVFNGPVSVVDINSAYPFAMLSEHPISERYIETTRPRDSDLTRSFLEIECYSEAALPARSQKGLDFPTGRGTYFITGWEFIAGLETNTIKDVKILNAFTFESTINFQEYIDHFYKMKQESDKESPEYLFSKLFMNSLYGKYASNPRNYSEVMFQPIDLTLDQRISLFDEGWTQGEKIGNAFNVWTKELDESKGRYYNICTSASITGFQRAQLLRAFQKVERPIYCDTDSIICKRNISLPLSKKLGEWSLEGKGERLAIAGKKLYAAEFETGKIKLASKGVRLDAEEIRRIANGETLHYRNRAPTMKWGKSTYIERNVKKTV